MKHLIFQQHALNLAIMFTDEASIPARFKKDKSEKIQNSQLERDFQENVKQWQNVIEQMMGEIKDALITRIVKMKPIIEPDLTSITENEDFMEFTYYFINRRDYKHCGPDELGRLAILHTAFQKEIEKKIKPPKKASLKNERAQLLMEQATVNIEGIEIVFWQKGSFRIEDIHDTWNKIKSYTDLNSQSSGKSGHIVFTGEMQITRDEISEYAVKLGFKVNGQISKNTNFVVVGSKKVSPTKISKALELREKGFDIKFMDENSFLSMVAETLGLN